MADLEGDHPESFNSWLALASQALRTGQVVLEHRSLRLERIPGGGNNALFKLSVVQDEFSGTYALKLCVADERRRAYREFQSLSILTAAGLDLAPQPLWLDESGQYTDHPAVIYRWLEGAAPQLNAWFADRLAADVRMLHELHPPDWAGYQLPNAIFHHFEFDYYLDEQRELLESYGPWLAAQSPNGGQLAARMEAVVEACRAWVRACRLDPGLPVPLRVLCRLDYNLANAVLSLDGRLRWLDWEYAGWGDPALELADIRWHASLDDFGSQNHARLRSGYRPNPDDDGFGERLAAWDRIVSARWPLIVARLLWSHANGPDRPRLSRLEEDERTLWARLERMIVRAEAVLYG